MLEDEGAGTMGNDDTQEDSPEIDLLAHLNKLTINDVSTSSHDGGQERFLEGDDMRFAKASQNVLKRSNPVFDFNRPSTKLQKPWKY